MAYDDIVSMDADLLKLAGRAEEAVIDLIKKNAPAPSTGGGTAPVVSTMDLAARLDAKIDGVQVAPATPTITSAASTEATTPTLTGSVESGASVNVTIDGVTRPAAVAGTSWTFTVPAPLSVGAHQVSVVATRGGLSSSARTQILTITATTTTPPPATTTPATAKFGSPKSFKSTTALTSDYYWQTPAAPKGLVIWLHGDGSDGPPYEFKSGSSGYSIWGSDGIFAKCGTDWAVLAPKAPDTTVDCTWWEASTANAKWLLELVAKVKADNNLTSLPVVLAGYSGGAQISTQDLLADYAQQIWTVPGGAMIVFGGGDKPTTSTSPRNDNIQILRWASGQNDGADTSGFSGYATAQAGSAYYRTTKGYGAKVETDFPAGVNHSGWDGKFGAEIRKVLDRLPGGGGGTAPATPSPAPSVTTSAYSAAVQADSPAAYYPMQEGVGATLLAPAAGTATMTLTGEADYAANSLLYPPNALGRMVAFHNQAGNSQSASAAASVNGGAVSLEVWWKGIEFTGWNSSMIALTGSGGQLSIGHGQNTAEWNARVGNAWLTFNTSTTDFAWHHLVLTVSATGAGVLYMDGVQRASGQLEAPGAYDTLWVGSGSSGNWMTGYGTQAALYKSALSAARVKAHYDAGVAAADPVLHGPVERWDPSAVLSRFTHPSAAFFKDKSLVPVVDFLADANEANSASNVAAHGQYVNLLSPYHGWGNGAATLSAQSYAETQAAARAAGVKLGIGADDLGNGVGYGSENVDVYVIDEPGMGAKEAETIAAAALVPAGMVGQINYGTETTMSLGGAGRSAVEWANLVGDVVGAISHDSYWYSAPPSLYADGANYWGYSASQIRRAVNYGRTIERLHYLRRDSWGGKDSRAMLWGIIELSHPNNTSNCAGPNPLQVEGAAWASIIGGARGIYWFHHSFMPPLSELQTWSSTVQYDVNSCVQYQGHAYHATLKPAVGQAPAPSSYTWVLSEPNGGSPITDASSRHPDLPAMLKKIKADLQTAAPAIYAPTIPHLAHKDIYSTYRKDAAGKRWLIAIPDIGLPNGGSVSMRLPAGESPTSIEVVGENRTITPSAGTFTDTFAAEYSHHIYRWS